MLYLPGRLFRKQIIWRVELLNLRGGYLFRFWGYRVHELCAWQHSSDCRLGQLCGLRRGLFCGRLSKQNMRKLPGQHVFRNRSKCVQHV